ncbi:MAG: geranylgeranyl reductase family protein [Thermoleophilia bacterium]|nr:geranylgeranyl reductase family protein [Thermoleophilia bacterium]
MSECDVLVIGAGPAGSTAAASAARDGARVILIDRRKQIGLPVQCAEFIPFQIASNLGIEAGAIAQRVEAMQTHLPNGKVIRTASRGIICNRDRVDQHLASLAREAGAELLTGTRACGFDGDTVTAMKDGRSLTIKATVIVGADGPASLVRRWMGIAANRFVHARQQLLPLGQKLDATEIFFRREIPGGYGWVFPKGDMANVGVGVDPVFGVAPSLAMAGFIAELAGRGLLKSGQPLSKTGGMIPVGGQSRLRQGNMVLAGDAAGHCHPITGAGVPNAIMAGELAGEAAARAAARHDLEILGEYEESCRLFLGDSLDRAVRRRQLLDPYWQADSDDLSQALKKSWIAFEEYNED